MKLCPKDVAELKLGAIWVLWDSGASCTAMKVARGCPQYSHLVIPTKALTNEHRSESTCEGSIEARGEVVVDMIVDEGITECR